MEPLLHVVLPFVSLVLLGLKRRDAALLSLLGVVPDLDAVLLVHRSLSHSILVMLFIFAPIYFYSWKYKPRHSRTVFLAFLVLASHPLLDLGGYTPILWPLLQNSVRLGISLNGVVDKGIGFKPHLHLSQEPTNFIKYTSIDYPLFSYDGLLTAIILLAPIIYQQIQTKTTRAFIEKEINPNNT